MNRNIIGALLLLGAPLHVQAASSDILVFSHIGEEHTTYQGDFKAVMNHSLDELARFTAVTKEGISAEQPLEERIALAREAGIPALAETGLSFDGKRRAKLTVQVYDTQTGEANFHFGKDYKFKDIRALIALLEFEAPIELKSRYRELGHVIKKDSQMIYFDLGRNADVKKGDMYQVFREGREIKNSDGNSFGKLKVNTGIVRVTDVTSMYATGEIVMGRISIKEEDYVERIANPTEQQFNGQILSVLDDQVAISHGKNMGVKEGAYYAVFKDVKAIKDDESFREKLGQIRINNVYEDYATGTLALSDNYRLSKALLREGDAVEEIASPRKNLFSVGQMTANVMNASESLTVLGYQFDSAAAINMVYRFRLGSGEDTLLSAGVMGSIDNSPYFFYGVDVMYLDGTGANLFLSADIPTPISRNFILNLETGYTLGGAAMYEGLSTTVSLKFPLF